MFVFLWIVTLFGLAHVLVAEGSGSLEEKDVQNEMSYLKKLVNQDLRSLVHEEGYISDRAVHDLNPQEGDSSDYMSDEWAMKILKQDFPHLIDAEIHGSNKAIRDMVAKAIDHLINKLLEEMKMSDAALCVFSTEILHASRFLLLDHHLPLVRVAITKHIGHGFIHAKNVSLECMNKIEDGSILQYIYGSLYNPTEHMIKVLYEMIPNYSSKDVTSYTKSKEVLTKADSLRYKAHEVVVKLYSIGREMLLQHKENFDEQNKVCSDLASSISAELHKEIDRLKNKMSDSAIKSVFFSSLGEECKSLQQHAIKDIHLIKVKIDILLKMLEMLSDDVKDLIEAENMLQPVYRSSFDKILDVLFELSKSAENLEAEIGKAVEEKSPISISTPVEQVHLQHMHAIAGTIISQVSKYLSDSCMSAKVVAMLIGVSELEGFHLQALSHKTIVYVSNLIFNMVKESHPEVASSFRRVLQSRMQQFLIKVYQEKVSKHALALENISLGFPTETVMIELAMLPEANDENSIHTLKDLVKFVVRIMVSLFKDKEFAYKNCTDGAGDIYIRAASEIQDFTSNIEFMDLWTIKVVKEILVFPNEEMGSLSDGEVMQVQDFVKKMLNGQVTDLLLDYTFLANEILSDSANGGMIIAKFVGQKIASTLYREIHPKVDVPADPVKNSSNSQINENLKKLISWQQKEISGFFSSYVENLSRFVVQLSISSGVDLCSASPSLCGAMKDDANHTPIVEGKRTESIEDDKRQKRSNSDVIMLSAQCSYCLWRNDHNLDACSNSCR